MTIYAVCFVGKSNEPLHFFSNEETAEYLHLQMIAHSCLDVIEEMKKRALLSTTAFDLNLGQLFPIEDYRCFGSYSNTHNKTIVICDSSTSETNSGMKETIASLNQAFVAAVQNPFQPTGQPIASKHFHEEVSQIVSSHNLAASKRRL